MNLTSKATAVLAALAASKDKPTARQLSDRMETTKFRSRRWSTVVVRGHLARLEKKGLVVSITGLRAKHFSVSWRGQQLLDETPPG